MLQHTIKYFLSFSRRKISDNFFSLIFQIASQRLADQIPLVIRYHMLQEFAIQLQRAMFQLLQDKENVEYLLVEDPEVGTQRLALQNRFKRLKQARAYLVKF